LPAVKLLMTWDILPGKEQEYFEYHIREFIPALENIGLSLNEAWITVYGKGPKLAAEAVLENLDKAMNLINSSGWDDLSMQLEDFAENFEYKVIPAKKSWQK
jgi:hypothetical protein